MSKDVVASANRVLRLDPMQIGMKQQLDLRPVTALGCVKEGADHGLHTCSLTHSCHQQYLNRPNGYCPDHGTSVSCPSGSASGPSRACRLDEFGPDVIGRLAQEHEGRACQVASRMEGVADAAGL